MDQAYQRQVEKEAAKDKELLNLSLKAQQDKTGNISTEQKLAELTAKIEKKLEEKVEKKLEEKVGEKIGEKVKGKDQL